MFAQQATHTYPMESVLIVCPPNTGTIRKKHAKDAQILSFTIHKNNNVSVLKMSHIFLKEDVFPAIFLIIGTPMSINASHVLHLSSTTLRQEDVSVHHKGLIWSEMNV